MSKNEKVLGVLLLIAMVALIIPTKKKAECELPPTNTTEAKAVRLQVAELGYASGCYFAFLRICSGTNKEVFRDVCYQEGLSTCDNYAKNYREWLRNGK